MIERKSLLPRGILILVAVAVLGVMAVEVVRVGPPPEISILPVVPVIGKHTPVKIEITEPKRGLSYVKVEFVQG